jgi:hypothetical protein
MLSETRFADRESDPRLIWNAIFSDGPPRNESDDAAPIVPALASGTAMLTGRPSKGACCGLAARLKSPKTGPMLTCPVAHSSTDWQPTSLRPT